MSLAAPPQAFAAVGFPRVSGDEPCTFASYPWFGLFSPRERG